MAVQLPLTLTSWGPLTLNPLDITSKVFFCKIFLLKFLWLFLLPISYGLGPTVFCKLLSSWKTSTIFCLSAVLCILTSKQVLFVHQNNIFWHFHIFSVNGLKRGQSVQKGENKQVAYMLLLNAGNLFKWKNLLLKKVHILIYKWVHESMV